MLRRIAVGARAGLVLAAATAGVLVAFGLRLGHPLRVLGAALPLRAPAAVPPDPITAAAAILTHMAVSVIWSTLFLLAIVRLRVSLRMLPIAALLAAAALYLVLHRALPSAVRPGYDSLLTTAQLVVLYVAVAGGLVFGIRLATLSRR